VIKVVEFAVVRRYLYLVIEIAVAYAPVIPITLSGLSELHALRWRLAAPDDSMKLQLTRLRTLYVMSRTQARNQGGRSPPTKFFDPPGKTCWTQFEDIGHSSKILGPSRKTLRPSWCPKLVTDLLVHQLVLYMQDKQLVCQAKHQIAKDVANVKHFSV